MKKRTLLLTALSLITMMSTVGCSSDTSLTYKSGDEIYQTKLVYDKSVETPYNVSIKLSEDKKVTGVKLGRYEAKKGEFGSKKGVLTISGEFLSTISTQEKNLVVTFSDDTHVNIPTIIATKVIKTAEEFQNINENLNGIYVLGNDIDLSSINNFEPLGYYISETDTSNAYFHGILEGNGYTVKNAKVFYSNNTDNCQDAYYGNGLFSHISHKVGDNVGLFQVIGSSGIVRNVTFDNIKVRGRTICGVIAGNNMGTVENCVVTSSCSVEGGTHFYDDDCNIAGAFGIVAGSGIVNNTLSYTTQVSFPGIFTDYSDEYKGKTGNGWDHVSTAGNTDPSWKYANIDKPLMRYGEDGSVTDSGSKAKDSNNSNTNGIYAFAGKCWGTISNSYSITWTQTPYEGTAREVYFSQTHKGINKPGSGETDLGTINACAQLSGDDLKKADLYSGFDTSIWNIQNGSFATLKSPLITYTIAE